MHILLDDLKVNENKLNRTKAVFQSLLASLSTNMMCIVFDIHEVMGSVAVT